MAPVSGEGASCSSGCGRRPPGCWGRCIPSILCLGVWLAQPFLGHLSGCGKNGSEEVRGGFLEAQASTGHQRLWGGSCAVRATVCPLGRQWVHGDHCDLPGCPALAYGDCRLMALLDVDRHPGWGGDTPAPSCPLPAAPLCNHTCRATASALGPGDDPPRSAVAPPAMGGTQHLLSHPPVGRAWAGATRSGVCGVGDLI